MNATSTPWIEPISPPEAGVTPELLVARAREMVPYLRSKAADIEQARRLPEDVERRLREAGFYRILQPRVLGGYEMPFDTFIDVMLELFRGDGASGWVTCFMAAHVMWVMGLGAQAQRDIFGADGDVRAIIPSAPTGKAVIVDGGYRITGRWDYGSGMSAGNWFVALAVVQHDPMPEQPDIVMFVTPMANAEAEDNWHVLGLRGTGSVSGKVKDLWVPATHCTSFTDMMYAFSAPGYGVHENPFYRAPLIPVLWMQLAIAITGMTRGLIDLFVEDTSRKPSSFAPFGPLREDKKVQLALGSALADHALALAALRQLSAHQRERTLRIAQGHAVHWDEVQADHALVCRLGRVCVSAAETLFQMAGSSLPIQSDSAFQRFYRDIKVASTHRALGFERAAENSGMAAYGLTPASRN